MGIRWTCKNKRGLRPGWFLGALPGEENSRVIILGRGNVNCKLWGGGGIKGQVELSSA